MCIDAGNQAYGCIEDPTGIRPVCMTIDEWDYLPSKR